MLFCLVFLLLLLLLLLSLEFVVVAAAAVLAVATGAQPCVVDTVEAFEMLSTEL